MCYSSLISWYFQDAQLCLLPFLDFIIFYKHILKQDLFSLNVFFCPHWMKNTAKTEEEVKLYWSWTWESSTRRQEFCWCQSWNCSVPCYCKQLDWACPIQPEAVLAHSWALDYLASFCLVFHTTILNNDKATLGSGFTCWTGELLQLRKNKSSAVVFFCFRAISPYNTGGGQNNRNI